MPKQACEYFRCQILQVVSHVSSLFMKFGKAYLLRIPTEFQSFALDYEELKLLMKLSEALTLDNLQEQIVNVDKFISSQLVIYPSIRDPDYQKHFKLFICLTRQAISKMLYKIDNKATTKLREYVDTFKWFRSLSFNSNISPLQLNTTDDLKRTPFHYMAITNNILPISDKWHSLDLLNHSPLFYAILYDHIEPFTLFLTSDFHFTEQDWLPLIKHGRTQMLQFLIKQPGFSELDLPHNLLHLCCTYDQSAILDLLLPLTDPNLVFNNYSALMIAAKENSVKCVVSLLISKSIDVNMRGPFNWTALEHASFRGFVEICNLIQNSQSNTIASPDSDIDQSSSSLDNYLLSPKGPSLDKKLCKIHKSYSHPYLQDNHSVIQVIIGTVDHNDTTDPIVYFTPTILDLALEMQITMNDQSELIALPIQDKHSIDPLSFTCVDPLKQYIEFKVFSDAVIGIGALFISSLFINKHIVYNAPRMTTQIPLFNKSQVVGLVTVQVVIINSFADLPKIPSNPSESPKMQYPRIIGHRGNGADNNKRGLHVAENTILSFVTAASLGAEYIEFDVQVTKDLVPVIYHDFIVKETGVNIPVNGLTAAEFQKLIKDINGYDSDGGGPTILKEEEEDLNKKHSHRKQRQKHVKFLNTVIKTPFGTLQDAFEKVPNHVGFNIEVKYPNHDEVLQEGIFCTDLNSFIDAVLKCVYSYCKGRPIFFSSFHPEVCSMLNMKQPHFPIFFLTDSGFMAFQDERLNSLQAAVRFAKSLGLMGIVTFNEPLILSPRLIKEVKSTGLLLFSYGRKNNDVYYSKLQSRNGIDAVIVDSVCAIRKGLTQ